MTSSARISSKARIGANVRIGDFSIVHDDVEIGDDSIVESHCILGAPAGGAGGRPLRIGRSAHIRSHSVLYRGSSFGAGLVTGHHVQIRENTRAGAGLHLGSHGDIQGDCELGDHVRAHSSVHVSKAARIGDFVWLYPRVQLTNDPFPPSEVEEGIHIEEMAIVATGAILLPGIRIGVGAFVAAGSLVGESVPDVHCVAGNPARTFTTLDRFVSFRHGLAPPWPDHFRRGYPEESLPRLEAAAERVRALMRAQAAETRARRGRTPAS